MNFEPENAGRFLQAMKELGYEPRNPVPAEELLDPARREAWKREKNMTVIQKSRPMELIDVFIDETVPFQEIEKDMLKLSAKGITIPVVSIPKLILLKRAAGRPQDLADIEALEALSRIQESKP